MLSRSELSTLDNDVAMTDIFQYWPRSFRNAMAQIIASIQDLDEAKKEPIATNLHRLRTILLEKTTYITVEDKKQICRLYRWFIRRSDTLRLLDSIPEIQAFGSEMNFEHPSDVIESMSGRLIPSVDNALRNIYKDLNLLVSYYVSRRSDKPLTLYIPAEKIDACGALISAELKSICNIEARVIGEAKVDSI